MLRRPGANKKKQKKQDRTGMLRLFAFCFFLGPVALAIAGWVLRNELWLQFMMESQLTNTVQPRLYRALGRTPEAKEEVKRELDRLVIALKREKDPIPVDDIVPLGREYEEAVKSGDKLTAEEARRILDKLKKLLDERRPGP